MSCWNYIWSKWALKDAFFRFLSWNIVIFVSPNIQRTYKRPEATIKLSKEKRNCSLQHGFMYKTFKWTCPHTELRNEISELLHNGLKRGLILALDFGPIGFKNPILTVIVCNTIIISKIVSGNFFFIEIR